MKTLKKVLALGLALTMVVAVIGCGKSDNKKEAKTDKLIMSTNAEFPPYEYYDGDEIVGIDAEIVKAIADKLGMELKIEDMAFDSIIPSIQSGKGTIGAAGLTITDERKSQVDFSDTYCTAKQVIIVKEGSNIKSVDDLKGKKIGVQQGTTGDLYTTEDYGDENIERYNKGLEAVQALSQGKIDCVVIDNEPAKKFIQEVSGLTILESEYTEEEYALAFKKGSSLVKDVNKALKELKKDGTIDKIISKHLNGGE